MRKEFPFFRHDFPWIKETEKWESYPVYVRVKRIDEQILNLLPLHTSCKNSIGSSLEDTQVDIVLESEESEEDEVLKNAVSRNTIIKKDFEISCTEEGETILRAIGRLGYRIKDVKAIAIYFSGYNDFSGSQPRNWCNCIIYKKKD